MTFRFRLPTKFPKFRAALILATLLLAVVAVAHPTRAEGDNTWQFPCFPQGAPDYAFGQFVSGWGYHVGDDICKQAGVPVYAAAAGRVVYSAQTPDSYRWGNLIIIEHTRNDGAKAVSLYGHLNSNRRVGAVVTGVFDDKKVTPAVRVR